MSTGTFSVEDEKITLNIPIEFMIRLVCYSLLRMQLNNRLPP